MRGWLVAGLLMSGCSRAVDEGPLGVNEIGSEWIEIYNADLETRSLEGWTIDVLDRSWTIGDVELVAGETRYIRFGGDMDDSTGMELDGIGPIVDGAILVLRDEGGDLVQRILIPPMAPEQSYGRQPDGAANWQLIDQPTPGDLNTP